MRKYRSSVIQVLVAVVLFAAIVSCATFKQNAYSTLYTAGVAYDTALTVAGDLYKQGKVTEAQKVEIIKYANPFYASYHAAVDAFEVWNKTQTTTDQSKLVTALKEILPKLTNLKDYLTRLNVKGFEGVLDKLTELSDLILKLTQ